MQHLLFERLKKRHPFFRPVTITNGGDHETKHLGFSRDISPTGIGLFHNIPLDAHHVTVTIPTTRPGDLVITADIPLAAEVVANGGQALDPRGELYTDANIGKRLADRNLLDQLRGVGEITGGPPNFNAKDRQAFANQLDRWLTAAKD